MKTFFSERVEVRVGVGVRDSFSLGESLRGVASLRGGDALTLITEEEVTPKVTIKEGEPSLEIGDEVGIRGSVRGGDVLLLEEKEDPHTQVGVGVRDKVRVSEGFTLKRETRF